jgi:hypothetical protein
VEQNVGKKFIRDREREHWYTKVMRVAGTPPFPSFSGRKQGSKEGHTKEKKGGETNNAFRRSIPVATKEFIVGRKMKRSRSGNMSEKDRTPNHL